MSFMTIYISQQTRSATSLVERGKINVHSCQAGDAVLLVWDENHLHYRVFLESNPHLHFLHTDSYGPLHLSKGKCLKYIFFISCIFDGDSFFILICPVSKGSYVTIFFCILMWTFD